MTDEKEPRCTFTSEYEKGYEQGRIDGWYALLSQIQRAGLLKIEILKLNDEVEIRETVNLGNES